jgi:Neuraminidase-like domain
LSGKIEASFYLASRWSTDWRDFHLYPYSLNRPLRNPFVTLCHPGSLTTLRYANGTAADPLVFLKLNLFVRLWRKLGWTIAELDQALQVFIPSTMLPLTGMNTGTALKTALVYLAHLKEISDRLNLGRNSRIKLLTLWSNLSTTGNNSLYAQLFLKPSILKNDPVFDHPLGDYLTNNNIDLNLHLTAVQGALNLTPAEIDRILNTDGKKLATTKLILADGKEIATAKLTLNNVSLLYRYGLLAKALKLSIGDLVALKELSGLDPLKALKINGLTAIDDDYLFTQTIEFINTVDKIKQSGFKPEDLDYLLRHNFDPVGKYRVNMDAILSLTKTLRTEIYRIQSEHVIPADASSITDEVLRQKLSLVLSTDVVNTFFAMWNGSIEYDVSQDNIAPENKLVQIDLNTISDPAIRAAYESVRDIYDSVRVTYDSVRRIQRLTFQGIFLSNEQKKQLKKINTSPLFADLLDAVQTKATRMSTRFFDKQLAGFLKTVGDFELLFTPILHSLIDPEQQKKLNEKRDKLVQAFFPFIRSRLIRQFIIQTLSTNLSVDAALTETLLTNTQFLTDPTDATKQVLNAFEVADTTGISASFFTSTDCTGIPTTQTIVTSDTTNKPNSSKSARLEGYFEVPTGGDYRFFVSFDKVNAEAELRLTHLPNPLLRGKATAANKKEISDFTELKPGVFYQFKLDLHKLGGGDATLSIQGETLPKDSLSQLKLYPQTIIDHLHRAHILLIKTFQLIQSFGFSDREIRYLLTHPTDFNNLNLSQLPTRSKDLPPATSTILFGQFLGLADYTQLKRELAIVSDDLIALLENARRRYPGTSDPAQIAQAKIDHLDRIYQQIATLTRREKSIVKSVAEYLQFTATATPGDELTIESPEFARTPGIGRLWEVLQLVEKIGIPVGSISRWATPAPTFEIARDLRNAVKARYETQTWQQIAQPIFDKLRQRQRDALVAYIMPRNGFDRLEQLFEYFLIDPGMEPVVQTSRIRLGISSVQLFIQRCLLNLEPQVNPAAINSKHWQWMKRYRVWEANRKIFLYPENWLEPEFRDDKTHLFQELEGTLLQSDISNNLAEDAFFNYLRKLEQLARLDIVTMYLEENPLNPAANTLHVIGRTYSLPHQYFYRSYAQNMWTPWGPITTQIEGDHLVAVVWRGRLHLFWVTFLEKATTNTNAKNGDGQLVDATFNSIVSAANQAVKRQVEVQLNWSEYFQGKWTTRESGGFGNPIVADVPTPFDKRQVFIHVTKEYEEGEERAVIINLSGKEFQNYQDVARSGSSSVLNVFKDIISSPLFINKTAFRVVSKNSPPEIYPTSSLQSIPYPKTGIDTTQYKSSGSLQVSFAESIETVEGEQPTPIRTTKGILQKSDNFSLLMPSNPSTQWTPEIAGLISPFFYQDDRHTFFVKPNLVETTLDGWKEWVVIKPKPADKPIDWWKDILIDIAVPSKPIPIPNPIDPIAKFPIDLKSDWVTNSGTVIQVGDVLIGRTGRLDLTNLGTVSNLSGINGAIVNSQIGGELNGIDRNISLNIIDGSGLNSARTN